MTKGSESAACERLYAKYNWEKKIEDGRLLYATLRGISSSCSGVIKDFCSSQCTLPSECDMSLKKK